MDIPWRLRPTAAYAPSPAFPPDPRFIPVGRPALAARLRHCGNPREPGVSAAQAFQGWQLDYGVHSIHICTSDLYIRQSGRRSGPSVRSALSVVLGVRGLAQCNVTPGASISRALYANCDKSRPADDNRLARAGSAYWRLPAGQPAFHLRSIPSPGCQGWQLYEETTTEGREGLRQRFR